MSIEGGVIMGSIIYIAIPKIELVLLKDFFPQSEFGEINKRSDLDLLNLVDENKSVILHSTTQL